MRKDLKLELLEGQLLIEVILYKLEAGKWEYNY
jgi:hypothetical protein